MREKIESLETEFNSIIGSSGAEETPVRRGRGRPPMSASARERIAAAQRARWAKQNGVISVTPSGVKKGRRKMSAEGRAKIAAAAKKRWAKAKAAGKTTLAG